MDKIIILPHGTIKELSKKFKCSRFTVSRALHTDNPGAKKDEIRRYIIQNYDTNPK